MGGGTDWGGCGAGISYILYRGGRALEVKRGKVERGDILLGRKTVLLGFALFGYVLGFLAWLLRSSVVRFVADIGLNQDVTGAILAGLAGGFLMVVSVLVWSAVD